MNEKLVYARLSMDAVKALIDLAKRNRRMPSDEAARIIELYLRKKGLLPKEESECDHSKERKWMS